MVISVPGRSLRGATRCAAPLSGPGERSDIIQSYTIAPQTPGASLHLRSLVDCLWHGEGPRSHARVHRRLLCDSRYLLLIYSAYLQHIYRVFTAYLSGSCGLDIPEMQEGVVDTVFEYGIDHKKGEWQHWCPP